MVAEDTWKEARVQHTPDEHWRMLNETLTKAAEKIFPPKSRKSAEYEEQRKQRMALLKQRQQPHTERHEGKMEELHMVRDTHLALPPPMSIIRACAYDLAITLAALHHLSSLCLLSPHCPHYWPYHMQSVN